MPADSAVEIRVLGAPRTTVFDTSCAVAVFTDPLYAEAKIGTETIPVLLDAKGTVIVTGRSVIVVT